MPYGPQEPKHFHLKLVAEDRSHDRRRRPAPPSGPPPRIRGAFGPTLAAKLSALEQSITAARVTDPNIDPHLIFRIPLAKGAMVDTFSDTLRSVGLIPVSIEPDRAVIAFRNDVDLTEFRTAIAAYVRGPRVGINPQTGEHYKSTKWDIFEYIDTDGLKLWSRHDRVGSSLRNIVGIDATGIAQNEIYVVDIELWHRGTRDLAEASLQELRQVLSRAGDREARLLDSFTGDHLCLARVKVQGSVLSSIFDLSVVAEIELPPQPVLNLAEVMAATARTFPPTTVPALNGPQLCIIDSGIVANHPLIANNVAATAVVMSAGGNAADGHGHGTMVGGLSVFGSVRACFDSGIFSSPVRLFSAKVLNDENRFDDEKLIINQIESAIRAFYNAPHNCRVFNLSIGSGLPAFGEGVQRQTAWAESLDVLARKLKIVLIVSAGNFNEIFSMRTEAAERVLNGYPQYLLGNDARLNDPATAAIAITVGSIAEHAVAAQRGGNTATDIIRSVAPPRHPSPFTRLGHGLNGAIKPEFVEFGGNAVFAGTGNSRQIRREPGTSVMSLSNRPLERLFAFDCGTSLAAPIVAREAAIVRHRLAETLQIDPDPNLVRTVLACAAEVPEEIKSLFANSDNDVYRAAGYGKIDSDFAYSSSDRRVTMVAQGSIELDKFAIYAVPIPTAFSNAGGTKQIRVALAFDPPVRRRRIDYLGIDMNFQMIRGKSLQEVISAFEAVGPQEEAEQAIQGACNIDFLPKGKPRNSEYRRNGSTLQRGDFFFKNRVPQYGDTYWLVVRCARKWAPVEIEKQDYAVSVVLRADDPELYNAVSVRLQQRTRVRARA